jgi:hypothetical protein
MIHLREPSVGKQGALSSLYDSSGLQVIFEIMEDACTESENDLIGEAPWSDSIKAKQAIAYAQRAFFIKVAETIDYHVAELRGQQQEDSLKKRDFRK